MYHEEERSWDEHTHTCPTCQSRFWCDDHCKSDVCEIVCGYCDEHLCSGCASAITEDGRCGCILDG